MHAVLGREELEHQWQTNVGHGQVRDQQLRVALAQVVVKVRQADNVQDIVFREDLKPKNLK